MIEFVMVISISIAVSIPPFLALAWAVNVRRKIEEVSHEAEPEN